MTADPWAPAADRPAPHQLMAATAGRQAARPAAMTGTPGGASGIASMRRWRPRDRRHLAVEPAHVGGDEHHEAGREGGIEAQRGGVADDAATERPDEGADVPAREHRHTRRPERPRPVAGTALGGGHGLVVEDQMGGDQPLATTARGCRVPAPARRRRCALPAAARWRWPPAGSARTDHPDGGELRRPGEHEQRQRAGLGHRQAAGHRQHPERDAEDTDGDAQGDGCGDRRQRAGAQGRWRRARAPRAGAG